MPAKKPYGNTPIDSVKHKDKRANIPTEELRGFVADDEKKPKIVKYQRDESRDPQLVWKGKDEQDSQDLEVPAVPIYIQEKIHPHAIIEDFRQQAKQHEPEQLGLFSSDFNGLEFDKLIEFYEHKDGLKWSNRMILGDSLLVMNSLAEKEGLKGKVQMIYLDPPYGIKFGSNWQVSTRKRDVKDGKVEDVTRQPEQIRAFRDTWEKGIHSYLAYLRDRLVVARELLTETGSIFVQIGDENLHLVRCLLDEIFGRENFINVISVIKRSPQPDDFLSTVTDYLLGYGKSRECTKFRAVFKEKLLVNSKKEYVTSDLTSSHFYESPPFTFQGKPFTSRGRYWSTSIQGLTRLDCANRIVISGNTIRYKRYQDDFPCMIVGNHWADVALSNFGDEKLFVVQTASKVIERCILMTTDPGDLVLDPTCVRQGTPILVPSPPTGRAREGQNLAAAVECSPLNPPANGGTLSHPSAGEETLSHPPVGEETLSHPSVGEGTLSASSARGGTLSPIESLRPGDYVFGHDGQPHQVLRTICKPYQGTMIGLGHSASSTTLWLTADHRVLCAKRTTSYGGDRSWKHVPSHHFDRAANLRQTITPAETKLWSV
ncbi:MAG: DNA methyltransferase, partial [Kovacikia sp.]